MDTAPWDLVWTVLGSCVGERTTNEPTEAPTTGSPTAAPITGSPTWVLKGCPPEWVGGNEYNGGDVVSHSVNGEESNKRKWCGSGVLRSLSLSLLCFHVLSHSSNLRYMFIHFQVHTNAILSTKSSVKCMNPTVTNSTPPLSGSIKVPALQHSW